MPKKISSKRSLAARTPDQGAEPQPRKCAFCRQELDQGPRSEDTDEHVYPKWFLRAFDLSGLHTTPTVSDPDGRIISQRRQVFGSFVAQGICEDCNTGWMRRLEKEAKPVLLPLMWGRRNVLDLSEEEEKLVARWAIKTAYTLEIAHGKGITGAHPDDRYALFKGQLPDDVTVFAARHRPDFPLYGQISGRLHAIARDPGHVGLIIVPNRSQQMMNAYKQRLQEMRQNPTIRRDYKIGMHLVNLVLAVFCWPLMDYGIGGALSLHGMLWVSPRQGFVGFEVDEAERLQIEAMRTKDYTTEFLNRLIITIDH